MVWWRPASADGNAWTRARAARTLGAVAALSVAGALGGCGSTGGAGGMASFAQASTGPTLAFESIDGPPPLVFDRLVSALNAEALGRPITIVARDGNAGYHVRGYLSAQVKHGRTVIAWVFDAYDANQQRTLRLSGEEQAGKAGRDAWLAADDQVLRRIAQAGVNGLAAFAAGDQVPNGAAPTGPGEPARGAVVASAETGGFGAPSAASAAPSLGFSAR